MTIKKEIECFNCNNGIIEKIQKPHSYDFDEDGHPFKNCNNCGITNDIKPVNPKITILKTRFNNNFIENVLEILSDKQRRFTYRDKRLIEKNLINRNISGVYNLAELIIMEAKELDIILDWNSVVYTIYSKYDGANLNLYSWI